MMFQTEIVDEIHSMGGSVRKDFNPQTVTHLVTTTSQTEKYRVRQIFMHINTRASFYAHTRGIRRM